MNNNSLILIVEDEEAISNFISTILTSNNYNLIKTGKARKLEYNPAEWLRKSSISSVRRIWADRLGSYSGLPSPCVSAFFFGSVFSLIPHMPQTAAQ